MLLCLSRDLTELIFQALPYVSCLALRSTCRTLYSYYDRIRTLSIRAYYNAHPRLHKIPFEDFLDAQLHAHLVFTPNTNFESDGNDYAHPPRVPIRTITSKYSFVYTVDHDNNLYCDNHLMLQERGNCILDDCDTIIYDGKRLTLYIEGSRSYVTDIEDVLLSRTYLVHRTGGNIFSVTPEGLKMLSGYVFDGPIRDFAVAHSEIDATYVAAITDDYKIIFLAIAAGVVTFLAKISESKVIQVLSLQYDFLFLDAGGSLIFVNRKKPASGARTHLLEGKYHTIEVINIDTTRHDILAHGADYADQITIIYEPSTMTIQATRLSKRFGVSLVLSCGTYQVVY